MSGLILVIRILFKCSTFYVEPFISTFVYVFNSVFRFKLYFGIYAELKDSTYCGTSIIYSSAGMKEFASSKNYFPSMVLILVWKSISSPSGSDSEPEPDASLSSWVSFSRERIYSICDLISFSASWKLLDLFRKIYNPLRIPIAIWWKVLGWKYLIVFFWLLVRIYFPFFSQLPVIF